MARWISSVYSVRFATVEYLEADETSVQAFDVSAWGLSAGLRLLLADYGEDDIRAAARWLTVQQNRMVAEVLESMALAVRHGERGVPALEDLFITVEAELYLPHGLKMPVACVTNIVPHGQSGHGMDKFVAVLDPGEAESYIRERSNLLLSHHDGRLH